MSAAAAQVRIESSPQAVFDFMTDVARWGEWMTFHGGWPDGPPGALRAGSSFRERVTVLGAAADVVGWTVRRLEPPSHLELMGDGSWGGRARVAIGTRAAGDATDVGVEIELLARGPGLLKRKAAQVFVSDFAHSLRRLDALMRGENPDALVAPAIPGVPSGAFRLVGAFTKRLAPGIGIDVDGGAAEVARRNREAL